MKYLEYRNKMDIEYFPYLRYSAYLFLVPTACFLYYKKYDFFLIMILLSVFSILRWTYVKNKLYQYIDHNFVKLVFFYCLGNVLLSIVRCEMTSFLLFAYIMNVFLFYLLGVYYDYYKNKKNVIFHMIAHLYGVFAFVLASSHAISYYDN